MLFYSYYKCFGDFENYEGEEKEVYTEFRKVSGIRVDERTIDDPSKFSQEWDKRNWYTDGENHRVENGHIKRDFEESFHIIEINTIEDLLEFQRKHNVNASVSPDFSRYILDGKELLGFDYDYIME